MLDGIFNPAFLQAAGRAGKLTHVIRFTTTTKDPTIEAVSCTGRMTVASIVDGKKHIEYYENLSPATLQVSADADTEVVIRGDVNLFNCNSFTGLQMLDLNKAKIEWLSCKGCTGIETIYARSNDADTAFAVADLITNADAADGTVYTNADGDYYSTIETAATTKGWTIKPLA